MSKRTRRRRQRERSTGHLIEEFACTSRMVEWLAARAEGDADADHRVAKLVDTMLQLWAFGKQPLPREIETLLLESRELALRHRDESFLLGERLRRAAAQQELHAHAFGEADD